MKHIVFTRIGVGIQRPSFFDKRLAILKAALLPSMAAQTNPKVHWLVVTDCRAPKSIIAEISAFRDVFPRLHLRMVDPIADGNMLGFHKSFVQEIANGDDVVFLSRVDDDDAVDQDYSDRISSFLSERVRSGDPLPIAATWPFGFDIHIADRKGRLRELPWLGPSIGIAAHPDKYFPLMNTHWNLGKRAAATGGTVYVVDDSRPMWAWLRHRDSDSSEFRPDEEGTFVPLSELSEFPRFSVAIDRLLSAHDAPATGGIFLESVDGKRAAKTRLEAKSAVLSAIGVVDEKIRERQSSDKPANDMIRSKKALVSLLYSI